MNARKDRTGEVWAHKDDMWRIYLLLGPWVGNGKLETLEAYRALNLHTGKTQRFKLGKRTKLRFARIA